MYRVGRVAVASGAMGARTRVTAAVSDPEAPGTIRIFQIWENQILLYIFSMLGKIKCISLHIYVKIV